MKIELTKRQKEIVDTLHAKGTSIDQSLLEKLLNAELNFADIEPLCGIINNEFMMEGILPNFEPNAYGLELENLLDSVNRIRTRNQNTESPDFY